MSLTASTERRSKFIGEDEQNSSERRNVFIGEDEHVHRQWQGQETYRRLRRRCEAKKRRACRSCACPVAARVAPVGDGSRDPASCGGGALCAAAAMSQEREKGEDGCEEDEERCPLPYLWARRVCSFRFYRVRLPQRARGLTAHDLRGCCVCGRTIRRIVGHKVVTARGVIVAQ